MNENKDYKLTNDQFCEIDHLKRMIDLNASRIKTLCNSDLTEMQYGFELGQIYSNLNQLVV